MTLATVDDDGTPSCRYVLLRGVDERGFRFFTSYRSAKGRDLDARGRAALTWGWLEQHRSIRATGPVRPPARRGERRVLSPRARAAARSRRGPPPQSEV
jgi:pyridoxine/pyridoxamine 5'-phosphate oxidase